MSIHMWHKLDLKKYSLALYFNNELSNEVVATYILKKTISVIVVRARNLKNDRSPASLITVNVPEKNFADNLPKLSTTKMSKNRNIFSF